MPEYVSGPSEGDLFIVQSRVFVGMYALFGTQEYPPGRGEPIDNGGSDNSDGGTSLDLNNFFVWDGDEKLPATNLRAFLGGNDFRPIVAARLSPQLPETLVPPNNWPLNRQYTFGPPGCVRPGSLTTLRQNPYIGDNGDNHPAEAWTEGQFVFMRNGENKAHWDGSTWQGGRAPNNG